MKLLLMMLIFSPFVQAQVVIDRGGGNTSQGELSDYVFIRGNIVLDSKVIQTYLRGELQKVGRELPSLYNDLLLGFPTWYLSKNKISSLGCGLKSVIELEHKTVACMTYFSDQRVEVLIDYDFWQTSSMKLKKQILVHEILRSLQIRKGLPEESLYYATAYFLSFSEAVSLDAALELRRRLYSLGFNYYLTEEELTSRAVNFALVTKFACRSDVLYSQRVSSLIRALPSEFEIENSNFDRFQKTDRLNNMLITKGMLEFSLLRPKQFCKRPVESVLSYLLNSSHF